MPNNPYKLFSSQDIYKDSFLERGMSYKDGMLLLIRYIKPEQWKENNQIVNLEDLNKKVKKHYEDYCETIKEIPFLHGIKKIFYQLFKNPETSYFRHSKNSLYKLLSQYEDILKQYTLLKTPYKDIKEFEVYSVWLGKRKTIETEIVIDGSSIKLSDEPFYNRPIAKRLNREIERER